MKIFSLEAYGLQFRLDMKARITTFVLGLISATNFVFVPCKSYAVDFRFWKWAQQRRDTEDQVF